MVELGEVAAARHDAELALLDRVERERHGGPGDVDLPRDELRARRRIAPVETNFGATPTLAASCCAVRCDEEPGRENVIVLPSASLSDLIGLSAFTYQ